MSEPGDLCKIYKKSEGTPLLLFYVYHFPQSTLHHQVMQQANIKNDTIFSESMLLLLYPSFFKITNNYMSKDVMCIAWLHRPVVFAFDVKH